MSVLTELDGAFQGRLLTDPADMAGYLTDYRGRWRGTALAVAEPTDTAGVAAIVRWCAANDVAVVPQGGNTGLSGGSVPPRDGRHLLLSLRRLDRVRSVDVATRALVAEAGVTLAAVQAAAAAAGLLFPLSLAAEGSCTIGGNLATNAGGVQVLRYGNARELCLGLEVVTAEGEIWHGLRSLRKDNTGYDLRDLYIGSEGTLGVITAASLKLYARPTSTVVALAAVPSPAAALSLLQMAQDRFGTTLSAFELLSAECHALVLKHVPAARRVLDGDSPWYVLLEAGGFESADAQSERLTAVFEGAFERDLVSDAVVASSDTQARALWQLREEISDAQGKEGPTIKHDIALPIAAIPSFIDTQLQNIATAYPAARPVVFGHLGDGNLHFNFSPAAGVTAADFSALETPLNRLVHDAVADLNGSISAEHGLGVLRSTESARYKSPVEMALMQRLKQAFDPSGRMNPGKLFPNRE